MRHSRTARALRGSRGAGLISVLIGMLFIAALGTALLYTSYTAYRIKLIERGSRQNFYTAESAMSEIRSGLQKAVTESVASAYTEVLETYGQSSENTDTAFRAAFLSALTAWTSGSEHLFNPGPGGSYTYDPAVLAAFPSDTAAAVSGAGEVLLRRDASGQMQSLVLRGIRVDYSSGGYENTVSADIAVSMPAFSYTLSEYSLNGVPEFAVIADKGLSQTSGGNVELVLKGNAYAGKVTLQYANNTFRITGGTLICGGNAADGRTGVVSVSDAAAGGTPRLQIDGSAALWAKRVEVNGGSSAALLGDTYLADDLELAGNSANVSLGGRYYGFGYLSDSELYGAGAAAASSSILVNGMNTKLDLTGLNDLMLAGNSYISKGDDTASGGDVLMGQSISVKSDQRAYLIPAESISLKANPYLFSGDTAPLYDVDLNTVLWTIGGVKKTLGDYVDSAGGVKTVYVPLRGNSGQRLLYFFMQFRTKDKANEYFRDYFSQNTDRVNDYLSSYVTLSGSARSVQTDGNAYAVTSDAANPLTLLSGASQSVLHISAGRLAQMYANLCATLSANRSAASTTAASPFDYVVKTDAVNALPDTTEFLDGTGSVAALIVHSGRYVVDAGTPDTAHVILCTGDILVDREYHGLLIAGGTVEMNQSVYVSPEDVKTAFSAKNAEGKMLLDYLNINADVGSGGSTAGGVTSWAPDAMVSYENWTKD